MRFSAVSGIIDLSLNEPNMPESKGLDILGIQPIADAVNRVTAATVDGAAAFLSRICLPAAEEYGLLLRDRVHQWRANHMVTITQIAEQKLANSGASAGIHAHPRLVSNVLEEGSWIEDAEVQEMWGGLLSSSCTETGDDDSNLLFVDLLSGLTKLQAKILRCACERARKVATPNGLIGAITLMASSDSLLKLTGENDIQRLDRELDHLVSLGLLRNGGFTATATDLMANLTPTAMALQMYVRCQGSRSSPIDYFRLDTSGSTPSEALLTMLTSSAFDLLDLTDTR
jgi:hypothetical protein